MEPFQEETVAVSYAYLAFVFVDRTDSVMTLNKIVIECIVFEECTLSAEKGFF